MKRLTGCWRIVTLTRTLLDLDSFLVLYLIRNAKRYDFKGLVAVLPTTESNGSVILTSVLRWHNDQDVRRRLEYAAFDVNEAGQVSVNPEAFSEWLKQKSTDGRCTKMY